MMTPRLYGDDAGYKVTINVRGERRETPHANVTRRGETLVRVSLLDFEPVDGDIVDPKVLRDPHVLALVNWIESHADELLQRWDRAVWENGDPREL